MVSAPRDALGREFEPGTCETVISLVPSLSETVVVLGGRLVGRTPFCIHPAGTMESIPSYRGPKMIDREGIIAARPDLVLAGLEENDEADIRALESAGLNVHVSFPCSLDDVDGLLGDLGLLLGKASEAAELRAELMMARAQCMKSSRRDKPKHERIQGDRAAILIWRDPWLTVGGDRLGSAVVENLGLRNIFADRAGYPSIELTELRDLDLLLLPDEPFAFGREHLEELSAALAPGSGKILLVPGTSLFWYGARSPRGLLDLARRLAESRSIRGETG